MRDPVPTANYENASDPRTIDGVFDDSDIPRLHIRIAVVHHDSVIPEAVLLRAPTIHADIPANLAIVESVQVHAFAVEFLEAVIEVRALFDVSGGVERRGHRPVLHIDILQRVSDRPAAVPFHPHPCRVPYLQ